MKKLLLLALSVMAMAFQAAAITGDVNNDGEVTVSDVNMVISAIVNNTGSLDVDVNNDGEISVGDVNAIINIIINGPVIDEVVPKEIELDFSELTEPAEVVPDDEDDIDYGDYVENTTWATSVYITFEGDTATVTGNPTSVIVKAEGAHVTVTSAAKRVRYIVSGTTANGSLKFYSDKKFQLQLNGVDITNPNGAAVNNQCGKSCYVVLNPETVNTLRDGENYTMVDGEDQKAALFSEGQILVSGKGTLNVYSVGKHCVASDDYILVRPGSHLYLNSVSGHGLKAKDYVHIKGGVLNMEIAADGAKGINCDSLIYITGGRTTILNSGTTVLETDSLGNEVSTSSAGVKSDFNITIAGGILNVKCTGNDAKGINVVEPSVMSGGEVNVVVTGNKVAVAPKGLKCDSDFSFTGGSFYSCAPNGKALDVDRELTVAEGYTTYNHDDTRLVEIYY